MNMAVPAGASGTLHWAGSGRAYYNLQPGQIISVERADLVDLLKLGFTIAPVQAAPETSAP